MKLILSQKAMDEELNVAWVLYNDSSDRCKNVEAQKNAKSEIKVFFLDMDYLSAVLFISYFDCTKLSFMQRGIVMRQKEKEIERDNLELDISEENLRQIDQREKSLVIFFIIFGYKFGITATL